MTLDELRLIVDEQAEDWALWGIPESAIEEYVQAALRRLHAAIEAVTDASR